MNRYLGSHVVHPLRELEQCIEGPKIARRVACFDHVYYVSGFHGQSVAFIRCIEEATNEWLVIGFDEPTRCCTLPDRRVERPTPNIRVVWKVDETAFEERLLDACRQQPHLP